MKEQRTSVKATGTVATRSDLTAAFVKGASFLALVLGLVLSSVASAADPNLVGWWKLDEGTGQTAYDSAGSNDGTITGATWTTGKIGGALEFDGNGDYVDVSDDASLDLTAEATVTAWIYPKSANDMAIVCKGDRSGTNINYNLRTASDDRLGLEVWDGSSWYNVYSSVKNLTWNEWNFVAFTYDDSADEVRIYIDGIEAGNNLTYTYSFTSDAYPLRIGNRKYTTPSQQFNGTIDDVHIYNRALSAAEIQAIMQGSESQLPGFRAPLLNQPASPSDFRSIVGQGPSRQDPNTSDPEIQELARALRYDPGLMYKFVHDYIHYYNIWGELKGPYMTWMDRSGNGFDQASLMIALLEEAEQHCDEYTVADPNYVVGEIQLSATQAFNWLNMLDNPNMAREMLARSGLYGTVTEDGEGDISNIKLEHVWVTVTIDGNDYEFDPSFKIYTKKIGLSETQLEQAMGFNESAFLANAKEGYDSDSGSTIWVKDINEANIESDLTTYSTNLINYIKNNYPDSGLADVIGGRSITAADDSALPPTSLPYTVLSRDDEFDVNNVPELYLTSLRIQHCGIDKTLWSSDIYGRRLTLIYNGSNQPQLVLDGIVQDTGNATTPGQVYDLTLSVDHPYDANDFDGTTTLKVTAGGFYSVVNGWGDTGTKILEKHRGLLEQYRFDGNADDSEKVLGESYALVGLTWLAQTSRMLSMAGEISGYEHASCCYSRLMSHHMLGVTGQYTSPYIDMALGHLGVYKSTDPNGIFLAVAGHAGAYEHEIFRQLQDCNAVSTVKLLETANAQTSDDKIFKALTSNWSSTQSQLQSYSQDEKDLVSEYVDDGFSVHLPQYGDLSEDDWTGIGFQARMSTADLMAASYIISGGYNGGSGADANAPLSPSQLFDRSYVPNPGDGDADVGAFGFGSSDLTIGNGGLPFGLSFSRQYNSKHRLVDGPLGLGWTHNFDITAKVTSDSFQALGEDSPIDAAAHIVALHVAYDILTNNSTSLTNNMIASLCETWLMDQMAVNLVTIKQGSATMEFVRVPDCNDPNGMYSAPTGARLKLIVDVNDTFLLKNGSGKFYDFDSDGRISQWSDAHGNVVDFTYDTYGKLTDVENNIGDSSVSRSLTFHYDVNDHITDVNDSAGRSIYYTYDANNLNLTEYENPDENVVTYEYDDVNDGQLTKIFSPVDSNNPVMTNVYDSLGRIKQQVDANDNTFDFFHAYYRSERLEPEQTDPSNNTTRFSTVTWFNEYRRPIRTLDQLGRETTYGYDSLLRLTTGVSPSGTSTEYEYDENHHVVDVNSIVIAGSGDPDISVGYEYDSYENSEGRWFTARKKHTDANECDVVYEYDYDDVGTYGTEVGNLMKITYPQVDPPLDTNRPIVTFTYYSDGQIETKTDPNDGMVTKFWYCSADDGADPNKIIVDFNDTDPNNHLNITTELTYDNVGNVATIKDPRGNITQNEYYDSRLLKKTTAPDPNYVTTYEYHADGKLKYVKRHLTDPNQTIVLQAITYTDTGQKETVRGPYVDGNDLGINLTQYTYDNLGRLWKVKDAENNVTETRYYPDGKVWKVIDALNHDVVTNTYDPNGYLQKVEDANDNATEYEYNGFGGLKKIIYADLTYTEPNYDPIRRLETMRTRSGHIIGVDYDDLHRVKKKVLPDNTIYYKYDLTGRVIEINDKKGTTKNTYDTAGRLIKVEYPGDKEVSYEYDAASNRTKLIYPDGSYITYEYDNLNRPTKIRDDASTILSSYTYDQLSRRTYLSYDNGTAISYQYDAASRLKSIDNQTGPGAVHYKYAYEYDKVGNRLSMTFNDTDEHTYSYDQIYQVTDVNYPTSYEYLVDDTTFSYDDAGNRSSVIDDGTTSYVPNELNQYSSVSDNWYDYDDNGNLTYDATCSYTYDAENHLTEATCAGPANGPFNIAVDNFDLTFTTGGDANWAPVTPKYCDDPNHKYIHDRDSARSGDISASQESWLEATVNGEGSVQFYAKKTSGTLSFYIDNQIKSNTFGDCTKKSYAITSIGPHTLKWKFEKGSGGSLGDGFAWIDKVKWTGTFENSLSLQQALDMGWPVATGGDSSWYRIFPGSYHDGDCAKSGNISDNEVAKMEAAVEGEGTVTFYWKVSSESGSDYLEFYIDGTFKDKITGEEAWQQKSYNLTGSGSHSLFWQYVKDGSGTAGSDCGWVDWLQGPGSTPPEPDLLAMALDCDLSFTTGGDNDWDPVTSPYYYDEDSAKSGSISHRDESWMQTTVDVDEEETISFYWKVSSEGGYDYLEFYIDGDRQDRISGEEDWEKKSYTLTGTGTYTLKWRYDKDSSVSEGDDCGWVDYLERSSLAPPDPLAEALDCDLSFTTGGDAEWSPRPYPSYFDGDLAKSTTIYHNEESWMQTIVDVAGDQETVSFYWQVSSQALSDYLEFYIDGVRKDRISGTPVDWQKKSYTVSGAGSHTLKWRFVKDGSGGNDTDCGRVDFVRWTGSTLNPPPDITNWETVNYKYDPSGRRIKKKVDNYTIRYLYDGGNVIGEYDINDNLLRKYIYGPRVDELVCMIDVADSNAVYYYHYDGLGSVVALSDSDGDSVQSYEYSVYGQVAAEDPNHTNPYMFTGRRFDFETGLYYYRARYYNPYIGRFLQTDPVGYGDGINWYAYCGNNPLNCVDPLGTFFGCRRRSNKYRDHVIDIDDDLDNWELIDPCNSFYVFKGFKIIYYGFNAHFAGSRFQGNVTAKGIETSVIVGKKVSELIIPPVIGLQLDIMIIYSKMYRAAVKKLGGVADALNRSGPWHVYIDVDKYVRRKNFWGKFYYKVYRYRYVRVIGGNDIGYGMYGTRLDAIKAIARALDQLGCRPEP